MYWSSGLYTGPDLTSLCRELKGNEHKDKAISLKSNYSAFTELFHKDFSLLNRIQYVTKVCLTIGELHSIT